VRCKGGGIGDSLNNEIDEINERWVEISGAFSGEREKHIRREDVMLVIVDQLGFVCKLSGLRVLSLIARIGGCKDEVSKHWVMGVIKESNEHIGALARGSSWVRTRLALAFKNRHGGISARVPGMNVGGGFGYGVRFDECNVVIMYVADNVSCSAAEAVAQCIVQ